MSHFRVSFGIIKGSDNGSAKRRSAYQRCMTEHGFKFGHKADELRHSEVLLPANAPAELRDPATLWQRVEELELGIRKDAQLSRRFEISIPDEVPESLHRDFVRDQVAFLVERGFGVELAIHREESLFNPGEFHSHAHAQVTLRSIGADGFDQKKDRAFNTLMTKRKGRAMREQFASLQNAFFERHQIRAQVTADPLPDHLALPVASKRTIRALERYRKAEKQALAGNKRNPIMPDYVAQFLEERAAAVAAIAEFKAAQDALENIGNTGDLTNDQPQRPRSNDKAIRTDAGADTSVSTNELTAAENRPDAPDQAGHDADHRNDNPERSGRRSTSTDPEITDRNSDQGGTENRQAIQMMDTLNEIDFGDAAIHKLQRTTGATDDYAEYLAEIEGHNRKQNNLEQLQKQRDQLAKQMAQITEQMEKLDAQIQEIQEVAQAPPAKPDQVEELKRQREALVRQVPDTIGFEAMDQLQRQIHEIDVELYDLGALHQQEDLDAQEPERANQEEAQLHLASVQRAANPAAYRSLGDMIQDHRRQREEKAAYERDLLALQNNPNKQERENDHTNQAAQSDDDVNDQKANGTDATKQRNERSDGHTEKANRRPSNDSKPAGPVSDNNHNATKAGNELPPLSPEAKAEMKRLEETKAGSPVRRSTVKPQKPPNFTDEEARRLAIERAVDAIKRLLAAVLGFGHDPMERAAPAGPRR